MRKFCLLCDTIDDQRGSTRRLYDVDTLANDLRLEMAHLSQCGMSVLMEVKLRKTENKHAGAPHSALTSTSLKLHKSRSNGLFHPSSRRKHLDFLKVQVPDTVAHAKKESVHLCSLPQSVEREYQRSVPVVQVSRYILQIPNPATVAKQWDPPLSVRPTSCVCEQSGFLLSDTDVCAVMTTSVSE